MLLKLNKCGGKKIASSIKYGKCTISKNQEEECGGVLVVGVVMSSVREIFQYVENMIWYVKCHKIIGWNFFSKFSTIVLLHLVYWTVFLAHTEKSLHLWGVIAYARWGC